ncbi:MAG: bifunctional UDP-N-acetylglucosamine diphosphorylase/glucosamine-1-phosphate N-acetyltransferase GlmU [Clostridia bacterium]|nr:bifunctional UDP-N-acetylglucosamine diphosphorylase/glucosamine-1-phosphate N-acetyltransferase GlmU [Clostridia bacterium]
MSNVSAIILAAGAGTRMKSAYSKVVHKVCGAPLVEWVYNAGEEAGVSKTVVVVGHKSEQVVGCLGEDKLYAIQEKQLGTGHAVMCAIPNLDDGGCVLVLSGDVPLITSETLKNAIEYHSEHRFAATIITAEVENPFGYGRIIRNETGDVKAIVEEKDASAAQKLITEINSGLYCFDTGLLRAALSELTTKNAQGEYYLTDTIEILLKNGYTVGAYKMADNKEIMGINDRMQLAHAESVMRRRIAEKHMKNGVTIIDPNSTYIGPNVSIEQDSVILPGTILEGNTVIGQECEIGPSSRIIGSVIGCGSTVENSVVKESNIGSNVKIGPFAYIRPNCKVADNVKVGDFVELKNSNIGDGTKISHLTYVGDSDVGKNVNFGCGTVTVNYDSKKKYRTTIGDNAFIGCNTNLIAPVEVGDRAYTAAGSTITENVPADSLAVARNHQVNKENWVKNKKF